MTSDGQLRFRFAEVERELRNTQRLAHGFLDRGSATHLSEAADRLVLLRRNPRATQAWGLTDPLRTRVSDEYEPAGRRCAHRIVGELDSTWTLENEDGKTFRVTGNVSTRVRLINADDSAELGRWRVELGARGAPGCFFHTQVRGQTGDDVPPWPHSVPVPRLPSPFMSIPSVLVFVLGELFQTSWPKHVANARSDSLAAYQREVWERRLRWELRLAATGGTLPWSGLKAALPPRDLFWEKDIQAAVNG